MLSTDVERCRDEKKSRGNCAFEKALQGPQCYNLGKVLDKCDAEDHNAPAKHADEECLVHTESLHQVVSGSFAYEIGNVERGRQPYPETLSALTATNCGFVMNTTHTTVVVPPIRYH